jgi:hypothetical protein
MFQTSFLGLAPLHNNTAYKGGFCKFWYIPFENTGVFPRVGPNQQLVAEPVISPGASWFGPIWVPRDKLGFSERMRRSNAGVYYELKVEGVHMGDSSASRINLENMPYHKYLLVGKVRAGGFHMIIGTKESPCRFDTEFNGGNSPAENAQTTFAFYTEHISKAFILPSFTADTTAPGAGGGDGGDPNMANKKEIIPFVNQAAVSIPWTATRLEKFGSFPIVEVWIEDGANPPFLNMGANIECDQPPPGFAELTVNMGNGAPSGFIVLS